MLFREELEELKNYIHNSVNFRNSIYHFKCPTKDIDFNDFIDVETHFDDVKSKKKRFEHVEKNETEFDSKLSSVRIGANKADKQLSKIENITKVYKTRENVIKLYNKLYNDYFKMIHTVKLYMI